MTGIVKFIFVLLLKNTLVAFYVKMWICKRKAEGREACGETTMETWEE